MMDSDENPAEPVKKDKYAKYWRTPKLAQPKVRREKYDYPEYEYKSTVRPTALTVECSMRSDHMARPPIRRLQQNKILFVPIIGEFYGKVLDKKIKATWETIYYYYNRLLRELKKKKLASKKPKKTEAEIIAHFLEWAKEKSLPKKTPLPPPIDRGKIFDLVACKPHLNEIASPKRVPSGYLPPKVATISQAALHYVPTDRLFELAKPKTDKGFPPKAMGVSFGALHYKISPRILEMSAPKASRAKRDDDVKENPFAISPAALKYKATDRIIELAKAIERD